MLLQKLVVAVATVGMAVAVAVEVGKRVVFAVDRRT